MVVETRGLRSADGVVVAQNRGSPTAPVARSLARPRPRGPLARTAGDWPGVFPWIRRSRLDIDKWLTEGEPNTAPLLHMQGHPFVRAGVARRGLARTTGTEGGGGTGTRKNQRRPPPTTVLRFAHFWPIPTPRTAAIGAGRFTVHLSRGKS